MPLPPILYVDDSLTSQLLMRKYLKDAGELTMATTLAEGLRLATTQAFRLIITDFLFPEGDAMGFLHALRASHSLLARPVVVVSGSMDKALTTRVLRAGANDCASKPLDPVAFRIVVERMLTQPYVRTPEHAVTRVACFAWRTSDTFFQHCPDLQLTVRAASREEATRLMRAALEDQVLNASRSLGLTSDEAVTTHLIGL